MSTLEHESQFHCTSNSIGFNPNLCRQLNIRRDFIKHLSLAILIGAAIGATVGTIAIGNPTAGAVIGGAIGGGAFITERYFEQKIANANQNTLLALASVRSDINHDTNLILATQKDIQFGIENLRKAYSDDNQKLSQRVGHLESANAIKRNAFLNVDAFQKSNKGYEEIVQENGPTNAMIIHDLDQQKRATERMLESFRLLKELD